MIYSINQTKAARKDICDIAYYLSECLKNPFAADRFLNFIEKEINKLEMFPTKNKGVGYEYNEMEIRLKSSDVYNIFYVVDISRKEVSILRVMNQRKDWDWALRK